MIVEATIGFEPMHRGFADLPLNHLGTSPQHLTPLEKKNPPPGGMGAAGLS